MPLDPMMSDALLGTFKNMVQECRDKNMSGDYFEKMCEHYNRLEELTRTHDDVMAFNMQVMKEDIYIKISDCYSRLLSAQAQEQQKEIGYDDSALLTQNLNALRDAIKRIEDEKARVIEEARNYDPKKAMKDTLDFAHRNEGKKNGLAKGAFAGSGGLDLVKKEGEKNIDAELNVRPNAYNSDVEIDTLFKTELYTKPIDDMIKLGEEPGMTYPRYLRIQIEKGLDKAMEGTIAAREGMLFLLGMTEALPASPHHIECEKQKLELFDRLAAASTIHVPNSDELNFGIRRIDHRFESMKIEWDEIKSRWEDMIYDLYIWSLSYCPFAPQVQPWSLSENPREAVIRTQKTQPGLFKQHEKLFQKYFGLGFLDIFKHPTFEWQVRHKFIGESQEFTEFLIEKIYPVCIPLQDMPSELIPERSAMFKNNKEMNPDLDKTILPMVEYYNSVFGEGRWQSKYQMPEKSKSTAAAWNWGEFRYKI